MPSPLNVPNLLTASRLVLTPFIVRALLDGQYGVALAISAVAGVTDGLDGVIARRSGAITRFGAYLDPIADKALLSAVYITLGVVHLVPWWLVWTIFGRDLLILLMAGAGLLFTSERNFPPSVWGKVSTFFQIVAAVTVMIAAEWPLGLFRFAATALLAAIAVFTPWSGIVYAWRGFRVLRKNAATRAASQGRRT